MLDRRKAGLLVVSVVLVHAKRNGRVHLGKRSDDMRKHHITSIGARAPTRLHNHWRIRLLGRLHNSEPLLHVVDVECRHAVVIFSSMVEQLAKRNKSHQEPRDVKKQICACLSRLPPKEPAR